MAIRMKILIFTAHPDDETIFAGGTIALLTRAGAEAHILCATRGEGGETGEPPLCERSALGEVRAEELRCAAKVLGCAKTDFLPFRDPDVQPDGTLGAFAASSEGVASRLTEYIQKGGYDIVLTHGNDGEYGHPGHVLANRAGMLACRESGVPAVFTFGAWFVHHPRERSANRSDAADYILDISSAFESKLAAAACHRTQQALFVRRPSQAAGHPVSLRDALLRVESFRCVWGADTLEIVKWFKTMPSAEA
jgi:N-acetylglucosamine malate deacetylase 2